MCALSKRVQILKFVAEQGIVSVDDVREYFEYPSESDTPRVILNQWGVERAKFGDLRNGIRYISSPDLLLKLESYYPQMPQLEVTQLQWHLIPHSLGINRIRLLLEKYSDIHIQNWQSENILRANHVFMKDSFSLSKIPDAVFFVEKNDGKHSKYFLEYERSLKSKQRYIEIFQYYSKRDDVKNKNVIYICKDERIVNYLKRIENECVRLGKIDQKSKYFQFLSFDKFSQTYSKQKEIKHHANF